jgi:hypothetical protein
MTNVMVTMSEISKNGQRDGHDCRKYSKTANVMATMMKICKISQRDGHDC